jgi:hypothetical protein
MTSNHWPHDHKENIQPYINLGAGPPADGRIPTMLHKPVLVYCALLPCLPAARFPLQPVCFPANIKDSRVGIGMRRRRDHRWVVANDSLVIRQGRAALGNILVLAYRRRGRYHPDGRPVRAQHDNDMGCYTFDSTDKIMQKRGTG